MHCLRLTAGVLYIGWQLLICLHVARGRETESIVKCLLRYSCISWYICTLALPLAYLYSLQLLKKSKFKKSSWQTQKDTSCIPFLLPAFVHSSEKYQNQRQHRNWIYKSQSTALGWRTSTAKLSSWEAVWKEKGVDSKLARPGVLETVQPH